MGLEKRYSIAIMSSSKSILRSLDKITEADCKISIHNVTMDLAIPVAKELEEKGVQAIIARGGTTYLLRENLGIPVLSIPFSTWDIISAIQKLTEDGAKNIFFPFYHRNLYILDKLSGISNIKSIFNVQLGQGAFYNTENLEKVIIDAARSGYDSVAGGHLTVKIGRTVGLKAFEIDSPIEVIRSLIHEAKSMIDIKRREVEKTLRYQSIIDSAYEGIIAVDNDGRITNINQQASMIANVTTENVVGTLITDIFKNTPIYKVLYAEKNKPILNTMETVKEKQYIASHFPIKVNNICQGGVSIYRDVSTVLKAGSEIKRSFRKKFKTKYTLKNIIYKSGTMKEVVKEVKKYAGTKSTILICGETGTGKELIAHSIHNLGPIRKGPFVSLNCAALPEELLESELFGYEEGSFTGAKQRGKAGFFELADGGTIFLDEICSTSTSFQSRLLRVLQEKEIIRLGSDSLIKVDVRVIAATNRNLIEVVKKGEFREDLFYRLNVLNINLPPLRDRIEDIYLLSDYLIHKISTNFEIEPITIPKHKLTKLTKYSWPGNVRELESFLERLILLSDGVFCPNTFDNIFEKLLGYYIVNSQPINHKSKDVVLPLKKEKTEKVDYETVMATLAEFKYNKTMTAKKLGISRTTLWRIIKSNS